MNLIFHIHIYLLFIKGYEFYTPYYINKIVTENFSIDEKGLPGNDDCGTISGWLLFSMIGIYPLTPASPNYVLGVPFFDKIIIKLNEKYYPGDKFIIENTHCCSSTEIKKIELNRQVLSNYQISHCDIIKGGELKFYLDFIRY